MLKKSLVGYNLFGKFFKEGEIDFIIKMEVFGERIYVKHNDTGEYIGAIERHEIDYVYNNSPDLIAYNYKQATRNELEIQKLKESLNRRLLEHELEQEEKIHREVLQVMKHNGFTVSEIIIGIIVMISLAGGMISFASFMLEML